jgi:hypothetical protein
MALMGYKTYAEEMREKHPNRPYVLRPTWELQNIKKALSMLMWQNTPEETQRLEDVIKELRIRRKGAFVR